MSKSNRKSAIFVVLAFLLAFCLSAMLAACGSVTVSISQTSASLLVGETVTLTATASDGSTISWESSDATVASVGSSGVVRGNAEGTATITASAGDASATCEVTVSAVTVTLSQTEATIEKGETITLTAEASDGGTITWKSSDETVATVSDGVVTAVAEGTATITASRGSAGSATCEVTVTWENKPDDYYEIPNGSESDAVTTYPDMYVEWHDQGWVGSTVTVSDAWYGDGTAHITFSGNTAVWYGFQLFYKNSENEVGSNYIVSFNINAAYEGSITVNGTAVDLVAGDNEVAAYYEETETNDQQSESASLSLQAGVDGGDIMTSNTFEISDLTFTEYTPIKLETPTAITIDEDGIVTITDTNGDNADGFNIAFMQDGVTIATQSLQNGDTIDDSILEDGEYDIAVCAVGSGIYENSDYSDVLATYTVANGGVSYDLFEGTETEAVANAGRWYYWTEFAGIENAVYANKTVSFDIVNSGNWYSNQIFYKNTALTEGNTYILTCVITSNVEEDITLNGTVISLQIGENEISVTYTESSGASFSLQGGVYETNYCIASASLSISDIEFTLTDSTSDDSSSDTVEAGTISFGEETAAVASPGAYFYWNDQGWCGSYVTVDGDGTYVSEDGSVTLTYSGATTSCWYGMQFFYENPDAVTGTTYTVTFTLTSEAAGEITVNGTVVSIVAGENVIEVEYTEGDGASLSIQMGVSSTATVIEANTVTITGITFVAVVTDAEDDTDTDDTDTDDTDTDDTDTDDTEDTAITYGDAVSAEISSISNDNESAAVSSAGTLVYWYDQNWCGSDVTVTEATLNDDGSFTIIYSGATTACWYGVQLFYEYADAVTGTNYKVTITLTSEAAGEITVNGTVVSIVAGENVIEVEYTEGDGASISIQMGVSSTATVIETNTVTINGITFAAEATDAEDDTDTDDTDTDDTDTDDTEDTAITYGDAESAEISSVSNGEESAAVSSAGTLVYWYDQNWCGSDVTVSAATLNDDGSFTITYSDASTNCWYGVQLFYEYADAVTGTNYKVTITLTSEAAGEITVNGTVVSIVAGENVIEVEYTESDGASLSIQMGVESTATVIEANTVTVTGITFAAEATDAEE